MQHYKTLGVDSEADEIVIKAAYRAMMQKYHPDTYRGPKDQGEKKAKEINDAYNVLKDPGKRKSYDLRNKPQPQPQPQPQAKTQSQPHPQAKPQPRPQTQPQPQPQPQPQASRPAAARDTTQRSAPPPPSKSSKNYVYERSYYGPCYLSELEIIGLIVLAIIALAPFSMAFHSKYIANDPAEIAELRKIK